MKEAGSYEGIPGVWLEGGKRWIASHYGWEKIRRLVIDRAQGYCEGRKLSEISTATLANCEGHLRWPEVHHRYGRGGGKRDDRPSLPSGAQNLYALCRVCHEAAKIQRRLPVGDTGVSR